MSVSGVYYSGSALREALGDVEAELRERMKNEDPRTLATLASKWARVLSLSLRADIDLEMHRKPDRGAILRMAGNIASGIMSDPNGPTYRAGVENERQEIAEASVDIARRILALVDAPEDKP